MSDMGRDKDDAARRKEKQVAKPPPAKKRKTIEERQLDKAIKASEFQETRKAGSLTIDGSPRQNPPRTARPPIREPRQTQGEREAQRRAEARARRQQEQQAKSEAESQSQRDQQERRSKHAAETETQTQGQQGQQAEVVPDFPTEPTPPGLQGDARLMDLTGYKAKKTRKMRYSVTEHEWFPPQPDPRVDTRF